MKPDDILNAIGEVDDIYIKKAHRKSMLKAILVFAIISIVLCSAAVSQMSEDYILMRFNTDFTVNTGYIDPEVLIHDQWTSIEQTTYANGVAVSTAQFKHTLYDNYSVTHTHDGEVTRIIGTSASPVSSKDYLGSKHYANLYICSQNSIDLIDRIDTIAIYPETAYGDSDQELNFIKLEYLERGNLINRQTRLKNGYTSEETIISSCGYSYRNGQISGWKEWDPEGTLLAYAEYTYYGNIQTVTTYLADGTCTGTRVSKYSFGNLKWREYYDASGEMVSREVYHYRVWELFSSLEGFISLFIILSLAATIGIGIWDDRIQLGTRLASGTVINHPKETRELIREVTELQLQVYALSEKISQKAPEAFKEELLQLTAELEKMNDHLAELVDLTPNNK